MKKDTSLFFGNYKEKKIQRMVDALRLAYIILFLFIKKSRKKETKKENAKEE